MSEKPSITLVGGFFINISDYYLDSVFQILDKENQLIITYSVLNLTVDG